MTQHTWREFPELRTILHNMRCYNSEPEGLLGKQRRGAGAAEAVAKARAASGAGSEPERGGGGKDLRRCCAGAGAVRYRDNLLELSTPQISVHSKVSHVRSKRFIEILCR
jgi:hypothetical protein